MSQRMQEKRSLLIKVEEQPDKYFDQFSDSMISASQKQNQMQTRKSFENNLNNKKLAQSKYKQRIQKHNSDLRKSFLSQLNLLSEITQKQIQTKKRFENNFSTKQ